MIRLKVIRVYQTGPFGEIRIYRRQAAAEQRAALRRRARHSDRS